MAEMITRKYKDGVLESETKSIIDWKPNAADLDLVVMTCRCGNSVDMPWDAARMDNSNMQCGNCEQSGLFEIDHSKKVECETS